MNFHKFLSDNFREDCLFVSFLISQEEHNLVN